MRKLSFILALFLLPVSSWAASCFAPTSTHGLVTSTPGVNNAGATILVAGMSSYSGYNQTLIDNVGNLNWNANLEYDIAGTGAGPFTTMLYKPAPTTSASYTFTILPNPGLFFFSATVLACSGVTTDHPLAQQIGLNTSGASTAFQIGSVTPVEVGDLIFSTITCNTTTLTASTDSGFSVPVVNNSAGNLATAVSWLSAPNTSPVNVTWTTNFAPCTGSTSVFKATGATPPPDIGQHITTVVGTGHEGYGGDNAASNAAFVDYPGEIVKTSNGLLVFADVNNNRIRAFNTTTGTLVAPWVGSVVIAPGNIATVSGTGTLGFLDNQPPLSEQYAHPVGIAIDSADCLYIADQQNAVVKRMCPSANVITVAGGGGTSAIAGCHTTGVSHDVGGYIDGVAATSGALSCPQSVIVDSANRYFVIGDVNNERVRVVNLMGTTQTYFGVSVCAGCIKTIFGQGTHNCFLTGAGTTSQAAWPNGVDLDASGNLYIGVVICNSIVKLSASGVPTTIAGVYSSTGGYSGDGGLATSATMRVPFRTNVAANGDLYITDTGNSVIRFVDHTTGFISTIAGNYPLFPYYAPSVWNSGGYCCDSGAANIAGLAYPIGLYHDPITNDLYISDLVNSRIRRMFTVMSPFSGSQLTGSAEMTLSQRN